VNEQDRVNKLTIFKNEINQLQGDKLAILREQAQFDTSGAKGFDRGGSYERKEEDKKEVVSKTEIEKLRAETKKQLGYARQQMIFWTKKVEQMTGSLAICNVI